jgi:hypothetical protein
MLDVLLSFSEWYAFLLNSINSKPAYSLTQYFTNLVIEVTLLVMPPIGVLIEA